MHRHSCLWRKLGREGKTIRPHWRLLWATCAWFQYPWPALILCEVSSSCLGSFLLYLWRGCLHELMVSWWQLWNPNHSESPNFFFVTHLEASSYLIQTYFMAKALPNLMWGYLLSLLGPLYGEMDTICCERAAGLRECWPRLGWECYWCMVSVHNTFPNLKNLEFWNNSGPRSVR